MEGFINYSRIEVGDYESEIIVDANMHPDFVRKVTNFMTTSGR